MYRYLLPQEQNGSFKMYSIKYTVHNFILSVSHTQTLNICIAYHRYVCIGHSEYEWHIDH